MRLAILFAALLSCGLAAATASAGQITGEYLEARTCDVYTGPCFANAQMGIAGKEALMAWKVDSGSWNGVSLDGLSVALVVNSQNTLGYDGVFAFTPGKVKSVILVDDKATVPQRDALVAFVRDSARDLVGTVTRIESSPMKLTNDHLSGRGVFTAGKIAKIETRKLKQGDCVCTNETVYYQPLAQVDNFSPAFSNVMSYTGKGLDNQWTSRNLRSAFLATFSK